MKKIILLFLLFFTISASAQVYTNLAEVEKKQSQNDSVKTPEYKYALPIWGKKATKKGFLLPYSAGISVNYFWQNSELIIDNLNVGFNNGPMYNLDEIIRFNGSESKANSVSIRPDFWLFPFLNIYGIFGKAWTSTSIDAGMWVPDSNSQWKEVTAFKTKAEFDATTMGFGLTPTIGVKGIWMAFDMNFTWTDVSALDKPVFSFVFGPRLGTTVKFRNPNRNIAFWVGGFRAKYSANTAGSLNMSDLFSPDGLQTKIDNGFVVVEDASLQIDTWWNNLSNVEKLNPVNIAKHEAATRAVDAAGNILVAADGALTTAGTSTVQYALNKNPKKLWNFIIGTQLQINRHFMLRAEYGFLGSRMHFLGGVQYRFGI
jgi:hypothetical protein